MLLSKPVPGSCPLSRSLSLSLSQKAPFASTTKSVTQCDTGKHVAVSCIHCAVCISFFSRKETSVDAQGQRNLSGVRTFSCASSRTSLSSLLASSKADKQKQKQKETNKQEGRCMAGYMTCSLPIASAASAQQHQLG